MQNFLTKILKQLYYIFLIPLLSIFSEINAQSFMLLHFKNHTNYATGMVFYSNEYYFMLYYVYRNTYMEVFKWVIILCT